jgi:excisionase family DNA binding protein
MDSGDVGPIRTHRRLHRTDAASEAGKRSPTLVRSPRRARQFVALGTPEAARYLGVHDETMRTWAREGVIPAAKLGNRGGFRFKREDLERFLERRRGSLE